MKILSDKTITATTSGKTILIGEHAVVYGYKAIAMPLPDITLSITLQPNNSGITWEQCWQIKVRGQALILKTNLNQLLCKALSKALKFCNLDANLANYYAPQITIDSAIPLGGGMGGSAAMSLGFLKLAEQIALQQQTLPKSLSNSQCIEYANAIDHLFHSGRASGLDISAISSKGIISYTKNASPQFIKNGKEFWLALIDSNERQETSTMVEKVARKLHTNKTKQNLLQLGELAIKSVSAITNGDLAALAKYLNSAHKHLCALGVSTKKINSLVRLLRTHGALAAKLTGAGGGGLVLALFTSKPEQLHAHFDANTLFLTQVPAT